MHAGNTMTSETISDERNATVDVDVLIWDGQYDALVVSTGRSLEAPVVRQWRQSGIQVSGSSARPFAEIRDGADDRHGRVRFCA
jgi:hypothetical protein